MLIAILEEMDTLTRIKAVFKAATAPDEASSYLDRFDETISPNMRALRLSMTIADTLIAMGVSVADVVSMSLDITERYCQRKVQFDISSTLITASQDRGDDREPLTLVRHAAPRTVNVMTIQSLQELVRDIHAGEIDLATAETRLDDIMNHPRKYPYWLSTLGGASISLGVGILFGASSIILAIMFVLGGAVTYLLRWLSHERIPTFFAQILSATLITLTAAGITWLDAANVFSWLDGVNPTLIVIGGIIMLVAGLAIVGAVQDAIDEFYVTANARLLKVVMMTIGIVAGVLIGMYIAARMGIYIEVDSENAPLRGDWQLLGALVISAGYALSMQSSFFGIITSSAMGGVAWATYAATLDSDPLSPVIASAVAAMVVGAVATLISRWWRRPSTSLMTAGIIPLVPGLTLYNGLFALVGNSTNSVTFDQGVQTLFTAVLIALAIASGVSFGHLIARPVRRTLVKARNALPRRELR